MLGWIGRIVDEMLKSKAHAELLESWSERSQKVHSFLEHIKPGLDYDIVPLKEVAGPTGVEAEISALIVSRESVAGGEQSAYHERARITE